MIAHELRLRADQNYLYYAPVGYSIEHAMC